MENPVYHENELFNLKDIVKQIEENSNQPINDLQNIQTTTESFVISNFIAYILKDDNVDENLLNQINSCIFEAIKSVNAKIKSIVKDTYEIIKFKKIPSQNYYLRLLNGTQFNIIQDINPKSISNATILLISNDFDKDKVEDLNNAEALKCILKICNKHRINVLFIQSKIKEELLIELLKINVICIHSLKYDILNRISIVTLSAINSVNLIFKNNAQPGSCKLFEINIFEDHTWLNTEKIPVSKKRIIQISGSDSYLGSSICIYGPNLNHLNQIKAKLRHFTKYLIEINSEKSYFELTNTAPSRLMKVSRNKFCENQEGESLGLTSYLVDNIGYEKYISSGNYQMCKSYIISIFAHKNDKQFTLTKLENLPEDLQIHSQNLGSVPLKNLIFGLLQILYKTKLKYNDLKYVQYNVYSNTGKITFTLTSIPDLEGEKLVSKTLLGKSTGFCEICKRLINYEFIFDESFLEISLLRFFQEYFCNNNQLQNYGRKEDCYHLSHSEIRRIFEFNMMKMSIEYFPNFVWKISKFERENIYPFEVMKIEELKKNITRLLKISFSSINNEIIQQKEEINKIEEAINENKMVQSVNINPVREVTDNIHFSILSIFNDLLKNVESFNPNSYQQLLILKRKLLIELVKTHAKLSALNSIIRKMFSNLNIKYQRVYSISENTIPLNTENEYKHRKLGMDSFNNKTITSPLHLSHNNCNSSSEMDNSSFSETNQENSYDFNLENSSGLDQLEDCIQILRKNNIASNRGVNNIIIELPSSDIGSIIAYALSSLKYRSSLIKTNTLKIQKHLDAEKISENEFVIKSDIEKYFNFIPLKEDVEFELLNSNQNNNCFQHSFYTIPSFCLSNIKPKKGETILRDMGKQKPDPFFIENILEETVNDKVFNECIQNIYIASEKAFLLEPNEKKQKEIKDMASSQLRAHHSFILPMLIEEELKIDIEIPYFQKFEAIRRILYPKYLDFINSISKTFRADNYPLVKRKRKLLISEDKKFIIKIVDDSVRTKSFINKWNSYFSYINNTLFHNQESIITQILGLFKISVHKKGDLEKNDSKYLVIVMENNLYKFDQDIRLYHFEQGQLDISIKYKGGLSDLDPLNLFNESHNGEPLAIEGKEMETISKALLNDVGFFKSLNISRFSIWLAISNSATQVRIFNFEYFFENKLKSENNKQKSNEEKEDKPHELKELTLEESLNEFNKYLVGV